MMVIFVVVFCFCFFFEEGVRSGSILLLVVYLNKNEWPLVLVSNLAFQNAFCNYEVWEESFNILLI